MGGYYDELETRDADERAEWLANALPATISRAKTAPTLARLLRDVEPAAIRDRAALAQLPLIRRSDLIEAQRKNPPLGGYATRLAAEFDHIFQSPGPIYEPGRREGDWWRLGRFLHATGVGRGDIVQNCFAYHLTPAGMMFDSAARAVDAAVLPAGTGQTNTQLRTATDIGCTVYAGTPDFLKVILERSNALDRPLAITRAILSGGTLPPSLRSWYAARNITARLCYATPELGNIAYESEAMDGMIVDEGVIVKIIHPDTGNPVPDGEIGEVVVTALNPDYPLIRYATGDLSAILPGTSPCGRTNMRIRGRLGGTDQAAWVKGLPIRPEQVADFIAHHPEITGARIVITRKDEMDRLTVQIESPREATREYAASVISFLKLRGVVDIVAPGSLPDDDMMIEDRRCE